MGCQCLKQSMKSTSKGVLFLCSNISLKNKNRKENQGMRKISVPKKMVAFVLAFMMIIGVTPINSHAMEISMPVDSTTGNGWDIIDGVDILPETTEETLQTEIEGERIDFPLDEEKNESSNTNAETEENSSNEIKEKNELGDTISEGTELKWAVNFEKSMEAAESTPMLFSERISDVTYRNVNFGSNSSEYIWFGPVNRGYYVGIMNYIKYKGKVSFCGEFNGNAPSGSYDDGVEGRSQKIKQIIACYEASSKSNRDYIAAQAYIWAELLGTNVTQWGSSGANENLLDIPADPDSITYKVIRNIDSPHTQNLIVYDINEPDVSQSYALKIIKKNADGSKLISGATFAVEGPNGFKKTGLKTNSKGEIVIGLGKIGDYTVTETNPPAGYKLADPNKKTVNVSRSNGPSNPTVVEFRNEINPSVEPEGNTNIKVETQEETETVVEQKKEYEYSDAIGQITIRKHDQDGNSLDSALFNILVEFSDGSSLIEENWEVDNGARLFTWTHPVDNHDPAKVTITEVQPPIHYEGDPTPKIVTVSPTFTRVTHVTSWTITITTTTTNVTIIGENGEVIDENISTATASTKSEPQVEEFTDFIAGDREITVTFVNQRKTGDIIVTKRDANTGTPLAGAHIHLWGEDLGNPNHIDRTLITDSNGEAVFDSLPPGTYAIQETQAPFGYNLNNKIQNAVLQSNKVIKKEIRNYRKDGLVIKKVDENGNPLPGATFELRRGSGEVLLRDVTNENGIIFRDHLTDDTYIIEEIKAPEGYLLDEKPVQSIRIYEEDDNKEYVVTFVNKKKPSIEITKVDGIDTNKKLSGAVFRIVNTKTNRYWDITTGEDGKALLEDLEINTTYRIRETKAPKGYINSGYDKDIVLKECRTHSVIVENFESPGLRILKMDADTRKPLIGAKFKIAKPNGELISQPVTDKDGLIFVHGLDAGTVIVTEIQAPDGYILDATPHTVNLISGKQVSLELTNVPKPGLQIIKRDKLTNQPIAGVKFNLTYLANGGKKDIGTYITGGNGIVFIPNLKPGYYVVTEIEAAPGYVVDPTPHNIEVIGGELNSLEIYNNPLSGLKIIKTDGESGKPLAGAKFKIAKSNGEVIEEAVSDKNGLIFINNIDSDSVIVTEIQAPDGYILDATPHTVNLISGKQVSLELTNVSKPGLQIIKRDKLTNQPIAGVKFNLTYLANGGKKDIGTYTTGGNGTVFIPNLKPGYYVVTEIEAAPGYVLDSTLHNIEVKGGEVNSIELYNTPYSDLRIVKIDAESRKPLEGAVFKIFNAERKEIATRTTSEQGEIFLSSLPSGIVYIQEVKAPTGYLLDNTVKQAELFGGKTTIVEIKNESLGSLCIKKIDSVTHEALYGATFNLYDSRNNLLGEFTTNQNGIITLGRALKSGEYKLKEVKAPDGYVIDEIIRTIRINSGETTEIVIENKPMTGNIQIVKIASEQNRITGDNKGELLEGAIFEIFDEDLRMVDKIKTDSNGIAISKDLPLGKYVVREVKSPKHYIKDSRNIYAEIKVHKDLIRFRIENRPEKLEVSIHKHGIKETMSGEEIRYTLSNISNNSNCALDEFYWSDNIPTDDIRIRSIKTGTYSEYGTYDLLIKTNRHNWYRVERNLNTSVNYDIDLSNRILGLSSNEYVTGIKMEFGTVASGFHSEIDPVISVLVREGLPNGHRISNTADVGGCSNGKSINNSDRWITVIYKSTDRKLPQTGGPNFFERYPEYKTKER